jgi:hypothetical protein
MTARGGRTEHRDESGIEERAPHPERHEITRSDGRPQETDDRLRRR